MTYLITALTMLLSIAMPLCIALLIAFFVKKMNATTVRKKTVFTLITAFLIFPIMIPIGGGGEFPMPHIISLILAFIFSEPAQVLAWYKATQTPIIVSFVVTFIVVRGMSSLVFQEKKEP